MTAVRAIIVDDEPLAVDGVRRQCADSGLVEVIGTAGDGPTALALIERCQPQAVFLDIAMPGMTGLELARKLHAGAAPPPRVILITAHDHFATEAFDLAVLDYVLKPIDPTRLRRAIDRLHETIQGDTVAVAQDLWVPFRGSIIRLPIEQIRKLEAERDYVRVHMDDNSYLQRATLSEMLDRLGERFIRVHRSVAVPAEAIIGLRHTGGGVWAAICANGGQMTVGRTYLPGLRSRLSLPD